MQPLTLLKKLSLGALVLLAISTITQAGVEDRLYDFTDAYYAENGVNPAAISGRRQPGLLRRKTRRSSGINAMSGRSSPPRPTIIAATSGISA